MKYIDYCNFLNQVKPRKTGKNRSGGQGVAGSNPVVPTN